MEYGEIPEKPRLLILTFDLTSGDDPMTGIFARPFLCELTHQHIFRLSGIAQVTGAAW